MAGQAHGGVGDAGWPEPAVAPVEGEAAWWAVAALEPRLRADRVLARVLADLADETRVEAIIDSGACAAWLASATTSEQRDPTAEPR
jgi:hypothetical protein